MNGAISAEFTDNVLNNASETSDTALLVEPEMTYLGLVGKHKFLLNYNGKFANYTKDSDLSYNEHKFSVNARLDHSHRINTEFQLDFDKEIETPGTTNTSTQSLTDFNKYRNISALARLSLGQRTSIGQLIFSYRHSERDYTNNQQEYRDFDQDEYIATFLYRVTPKTRLLFQVSSAEYNYDTQQNNSLTFNQSSTQKTYLAGLDFAVSTQITGRFKIGYQDKDYDDVRFNDISGLSYLLDGTWKPTIFTHITFSATRQTTESAQVNEGGFLSTSYAINLSHQLTSRSTITTKLSRDNDDVVFTLGSADRTDKRNTINIGLSHSLRTWLDIKLVYKYQEKTSNSEIFEFQTNSLQLSLETTF